MVGSALLYNTDIDRGLLAKVFSDVERIPPVSLRTSRIKDNASIRNFSIRLKKGYGQMKSWVQLKILRPNNHTIIEQIKIDTN